MLVMLKGGGHNKFWGSFYAVAILNKGSAKSFPCLSGSWGGGGGGRKRFRTSNFPIL